MNSINEIINQLVREQFYRNIGIIIDIQKTINFKLNRDDPISFETFITLIHYLLTTLNEKQFYKKIHWPIHDRKSEAEFRRDIVKYLNELNLLYKIRPPLPTISLQNIHLTTKSDLFINFMFLLSQFILERLINEPGKGLVLNNFFQPLQLGYEEQDIESDLEKLRIGFQLFQMEKTELMIVKNNYLEDFDKFEEMKPKCDLEPYKELVKEIDVLEEIKPANESVQKANEQMEQLLGNFEKNPQTPIDLPKLTKDCSEFIKNFSQSFKIQNLEERSKKPIFNLEENFGQLQLISNSLEEAVQSLIPILETQPISHECQPDQLPKHL